MVLLTISVFSQNQTEDKELLILLAREFVTNLARGDFEGAVTNFEKTMTKLSPPEKLKEVWDMVIGQVGPFKKQLGVRMESLPKYDIVYVTCAFQKQNLDIKVVFDKNKKVAGQFFVPTQPQAEYSPPSYVRHESFLEKDVTLGLGEWELPGTLALPKNGDSFPALILVHGSGPQDRDETIGPNKPFRDLALGLASRGIAVLRYDKRTKVHSSKILSSKELRLTVQEETIDDCLSAVTLVREIPEIDVDSIFVLGHSLGGTLIPRIAEQDSSICGFIILAGSTRKLEEIYLQQVEYICLLDGQISDIEQDKIDEAQGVIDKIKRLDESDIETNRISLLGAYPEYWLDLRDYNPAENAKNISRPLFILQGGRDYQVTPKDFEGWRSALFSSQNVSFKLYPTLNHLFIAGEGRSSPAEYQRAGNVSKEVVDDIAAWIKSRALKHIPFEGPRYYSVSFFFSSFSFFQ
jgi:hypothetical protein